MAFRLQSGVEALTNYGVMLFAVAVALAAIFLLSNIPNTTVPNSCYLYGSLNCLDLAYSVNSVSSGASLVVYLQMSFPGGLNVSEFNAAVGGIKSTSGFCTSNGIKAGSTFVSQGHGIICVANFTSISGATQVYSGTFNLTTKYCATATSSSGCLPGGSSGNYMFAGSWRAQGSNGPFPINSIILRSTTTVGTTTTTSVSTTTSIPSGALPVYAYVQGGAGANGISVIDTATQAVNNVFIASNLGPAVDVSCISVTPDQQEAYLIYTYTGFYAYNSVTGSIAKVSGTNVAASAVTPVVSPDGASVYVADDLGSSTVEVDEVSTATNMVTHTVSIHGGGGATWYAQHLILSPDGNMLYFASYSSDSGLGAIYTINTVTHTLVNTMTESGWPLDLAISPDGSTLYVVLGTDESGSGNVIQVVNTNSYTVSNTIPIFGMSSSQNNGLFTELLSSDGSTLYALSSNYGVLVKMNTADDTYTKISVPNPSTSNPEEGYFSLSGDGSTAYIPAQLDGAPNGVVYAVNTATAVYNTITVGSKPVATALTPDGSLLYVLNSGSDTVSVINTATNHVDNTLVTQPNPQWIAIAGGSYAEEPT